MAGPKRDFVLSQKKPSQGAFNQLLGNAAKLAVKKGYQPFLYIMEHGCRACHLIERNLDHPALSRVFSHCYLIKVQYSSWMMDLFKNHLKIKTAPFFVRLTDAGEITDYRFAAGDWEEDTPESAAEHLAPYFSDRSDKVPTQVSKEMLCEKLYWDVFTGDFAAVKHAIDESGCDPLRLQEDDATYLHVTASILKREVSEAQVIEIAGYFLDKGVDIDKLASTRGTALTRSIEEHYFELARMLVERGADVNLHNETRNSPLHLAVISGQLELVTLLLQHGADVNARGRWARTPLHHAPDYGIQFAELLLAQGADVNLTDKEGDSPVHNLLNRMEWNDQLMDYLQTYVESGADLNKTNGKGQTPLEIVASYESERPHHTAIKQYLLEKSQPV